MKVRGAEGITRDQMNLEIQRGARFVYFQYAISIVMVSFRRNSDIYFIRTGESAISKSIGFTLLSLAAGWWGIPWGPVYTIQALTTNWKGGKDVTNQVAASSGATAPSAAATVAPISN